MFCLIWLLLVVVFSVLIGVSVAGVLVSCFADCLDLEFIEFF